MTINKITNAPTALDVISKINELVDGNIILDSVPTLNSDNGITSGAVYSSLDTKVNSFTINNNTDTTGIVTLTPVANNIYKYGALTSLTLSTIPNSDLETIIYFISDTTTAATISLPTGTKIIGDMECTAGKQHVITILNGICVLGVCK